ncbi:MAG: hypothetical protein MRERV_7c034 [Mycoplasmataceae bacterium RV_VA103A]|nr:MAG: hypothetical protein MRERV_7c034 [Mycoplasmataceae bacterium RV_VA103A]
MSLRRELVNQLSFIPSLILSSWEFKEGTFLVGEGKYFQQIVIKSKI